MATTVAELEVVVGADTSEAEAGLDRVNRRVGSTAKDVRAAGTVMLGGGVALAAGLFQAASAAVTFDAAMNGVAAVVGGQANPQMEALRELALDIGTATVFSATEGAQAIAELAKAGVPLDTILGGAAMSAAELAAATGESIPFAAEVMANSLNLFAASGLNAADASDILVGAANASSAEIGDLAAGMRSIGPVAAGFGESFADTATAVALFTKFGLPAADAGVSLRAMLTDLATPTSDAAELMRQLGISAFNAQGDFVGFPALFDQLAGAMGGMTDEQKQQTLAMLVGAEAADVMMLAIENGGDAFRELRAEVEPSGQAADAAAARMAGVSGAMEQLRGSIETASILLGEVFTPYVEAAAVFLRQLVDAFSALPAPVRKVIGLFLAAASAALLLGGAVAVFGPGLASAAKGFWAIGKAVFGLGRALSLLRFVLLGVLGPWGLLIAALTGLAILAYTKNWFGFADALNKVGAFVKRFVTDFDVLRRAFQVGGLAGVRDVIAIWLDMLFGADVSRRFVQFTNAVATVWATVSTVVAAGVAAVMPHLLRFGAWFVGSALPAIWSFAQAVYAVFVGTILPAVVAFVQTVWPYLVRFGDWFLFTAVPAVWSFAQAVYGVFVGQILPAIVAFVQAVWPYLLQFGNWFLFTAIPALYAFAAAVVGFITGTVVPALVTFWATVGPPLIAFADWLLFTAVPAVAAFVGAVVEGIGQAVAVVSGVWDAVSEPLASFAGWFVGAVATVTGFATDTATAFAGLVSSVATTAGEIVASVSGIATSITGAFSGLYTTFYNFGADILRGLIDGMAGLLGELQGMIGQVTGALSQVGDWIMPGSPSKRTLGWARSYVEGFTSAIGAGIPQIASAAGGVTAALTPRIPAPAGAPLAPATAGARTVNFSPTINVNGAATNDQTADVVVQKVYQSLERLLAGGAV